MRSLTRQPHGAAGRSSSRPSSSLLGIGGAASSTSRWVKAPGDVTNENAEFQDTAEPDRAAARGAAAQEAQGRDVRLARLRLHAEPHALPERRHRAAVQAALEVPRRPPAHGVPAGAGARRLFFVSNDGVAVALNAKTRQHHAGSARIGSLNASSPATTAAACSSPRCPGHVTSLDAKTGTRPVAQEARRAARSRRRS